MGSQANVEATSEVLCWCWFCWLLVKECVCGTLALHFINNSEIMQKKAFKAPQVDKRKEMQRERNEECFLDSITTSFDWNNVFELVGVDAEACTLQPNWVWETSSGAKHSCHSHPLLMTEIMHGLLLIVHSFFIEFNCIKCLNLPSGLMWTQSNFTSTYSFIMCCARSRAWAYVCVCFVCVCVFACVCISFKVGYYIDVGERS